MKKVFLIRLSKILALILPIAILAGILQNYFFFFHDDNTERIRSFYNEEKNSLDVVFLGASELHNGFSPGYAYGKYGFTSYLYTIGSNPCTLYKSELTEILAHQNPQLIFVDMSGFLYVEQNKLSSEACLRIYTENIPASFNKLDTIMSFPYEDKLSCFLPLVKYHGDWVSSDQAYANFQHKLAQSDTPSFLKGVVTNTKPYDAEPEVRILNKPIEPGVEEASLSYMKDFLAYCQEQKLDNIVFLNLPRNLENDPNNAFRNRTVRMVDAISASGFPVIDLQEHIEQIGFSFSEDYYDFEHPNIFGQIKLTDYISQLIINQYHVSPMPQSKENTLLWQESALCARAFVLYAEQLSAEGNSVFLIETPELIALLKTEYSD